MNSDSSEQSSGFWTLTRNSKLSKKFNNESQESRSDRKSFNICVVGLSGPDKDKGPIGIGKSCFCNRFVRSAADDYQTDHISVLSQSDFNGRVVNNDHWLFWGSVTKSCDGCDLEFQIVEQTEFVDDSSLQPFKLGKIEPYFKRCANTKLVSPEKLMYICKNQLGIEKEYEQKYLYDGKLHVDGFLCLFDVSEVHGRNIDRQIEITNLILINLVKTKKPVVFVTTKHDEANELLVAEAERLINQRDFRGIVPIVESSAQENVNVNMAFLICAQMIDKTRAKFRIPSYFEAHRNQIDMMNAAREAYMRLVTGTVIDYKASWQQVCIKLSHNPEFLQFTYLHGLDTATMLFKSHLKRLKDDCISQKVEVYRNLLPDILAELIPIEVALASLKTDSNWLADPRHRPNDWDQTKQQIRSNPLFDKYFVEIPPNICWYDTELLQSNDNRIPTDWLDTEEAHKIFQTRSVILETEQKRRSAKELFIHLLNSINIPVGRPFIEIKPMFAGNQNFDVLSDQELFEIYVDFQNNLLQKARSDFQELLLENAEHLQPLAISDKIIRQEDIHTINNILQHDERYQALDRFAQDRTLMMIRHLNFLYSQSSSQCPSNPMCVEPELERLFVSRAKSIVAKHHESKTESKTQQSNSKSCDIIIFGPRRPSQQLILALNVLNSRSPKESQYQITFTVFDNSDEIDVQAKKFNKSTTKPKGCFGIFTNHRSLEHVNFTLEKFLMINYNGNSDKYQIAVPPIVILYAADITLDEVTMLSLENDGQQLAQKFRCPFMNVTAIDQYRQHQQNNLLKNDQDSASQIMSECASLDYACVDAAFNVLKESITKDYCFIELYNNPELVPHQAFNPDSKVLMCFLCGEPFSCEALIWNMFIQRDDCYVTSPRSFCVKYKTDKGLDRYIEIIVASYTHGASNYRDENLYGFILTCSTQRRASVSILNAFSYNTSHLPVLILAVDEDDKSAIDDELKEEIFRDIKSTTIRLNSHLEIISKDIQNCDNWAYLKNLNSFLQTVVTKRRPSIEKVSDPIVNELSTPVCNAYEDESTTPGKLDLSQFNNITSAIGKLNIQGKATNELTQLPVAQASSSHQRQSNQDAESPPQDSGFFKGRAKKSKNRAKDLRQNHGRAVAPPKLPSESIINSKVNLDTDLIKSGPLHGKYTHITDDDCAIDSNLSPIATRLLKHSKDYKVSELVNSPCESDNENSPQITQISRNRRPMRGMSLGPDFGNTVDSAKPNNINRTHNIDLIKSSNSLEEKIRNLDKLLASKPAPGISGLPKHLTTRSASLDQENGHNDSLIQLNEKNVKALKKDKKKLRDDEKMEKRRLKEEEKQRKEEKRQEKKLASKKSNATITSLTITEEGVPFFVKRCIEFIEIEGLDAEGIYRVPGNRAHVDTFVQKFKENPHMDINESDIPVNAVATALKDFLSKKIGPIIPTNLMEELTDISGQSDKEARIKAFKDLVSKLPTSNYKLLKYVFSHFVRISHNHSVNSMDSKNLAICWWPTLLPFHFSDMGMFEQMRPHLEESIQTMIDKFDEIFTNDEPTS